MFSLKRLFVATTLAVGLPAATHAQELDWAKTYSLPSSTFIQDLHVEGDDLYVVWDTYDAINYEQGVAVQKIAGDGGEQWRYKLALYYTDWSDPTELEFARDTAANLQGLYFIHDDSNGKSIVATSSEGENLWSVAAQNSGWFSEDYPKTSFTELYAADDVLYVKGSITETQGAQAVGYLFVYDQSGDEISREQDVNSAKFNAEKFAGGVNYSVDYDANTITVLANDGSVSQVIESNNPIQSVAYGNGYFYVTQSTGTVTDGGYRLVRYDLDGDLWVLNAFSPKFAKTDASTTTVKVGDQGIYTFGYQFTAECCDSEKIYRLAQYDFDGELTSAKYYRDIPQSQPWTLLTVEQGAAYLQIGEAVSDVYYDSTSNYIAKIDLSESAYFALPELSIHAMEQLPVSGELGLAVVSQGVAENTLIQEIAFGGEPTIAQDFLPQVGRQFHIDSVLYPNTDGSVQLATLMQYKSDTYTYGLPEQAELKTEVALSQSDAIDIYADGTEHVAFNTDNAIATPLDLIVIPDQNGNGTYELGVVSELPNKGGVFLEVRDPNGDSDELMFRVSFNPNFSPKDVALVQDLDGDDRPEIALLSVNDSKGQSKVEVRSLDGNLIKNLWPGNSHKAEFFVEPQLDDSFAPVPAAELAVVQVKAEGKGVRVVTLDVATGKPVKYKGLNPNFIPVKAVAMPDINNNGASEYAILSQSTTMVDGAEQLKARIDIVDTASNKTINQIWHRKNATVYDLAVVPDQNGNQTVELATAIWQDGGLKLKIQDGLTDALISTQSLKVVH